jgi:ABC-type transporter Mla subunit MlaD
VRRAVLAVLALVVALGLLRGGGSDPDLRVAAVFDTARGIVPGQVVKIAGARVGTVTDVRLAPGPAARLELRIDGRHGPFRADASCRILPEGFISENYVECDPGDPGQPELRAADGGMPTVERRRTAVPLALQDVLNVFSAPTPQRLQVLFSSLGMATAGRGADLNAVLRRANPALGQARRALDVLGDENRRLGSAVDATDTVLRRLARQDGDVRAFVRRTDAVVRTTAARRAALSRTVRDLPRALATTRRALGSLGDVAREARPALRQVRAAAPGLVEATRTIPAFAAAGTPALSALSASARKARPVVRSARTTVRRLGRLAGTTATVSSGLDDLLVDLRDTGGIEGLMNLGYRLAAQSAAHDDVSHMAGVYIGIQPRCLADIKFRGCSHAYDTEGDGTIPVNVPSAGPQLGWDTAMTDARVTSTPAPASGKRKLDPKTMRDLLEYLL